MGTGNTLRLASLGDGRERFVLPTDPPAGEDGLLTDSAAAELQFGVGPLAVTNARGGFVAFCEEGPRPRVHVHSLKTLESVATLVRQEGSEDAPGASDTDSGPTLAFAALAFSRCGTRLVVVEREPQRRLSLWAWQEGELLVEKQDVGHDVAEVSLNPLNSDQLVTSGSGGLAFWTVERVYHRLYFTGVASVPGVLEPHCHYWNPLGGVWVGCLGGELLLYRFNAVEPEPALCEPFPGPLRSMVVTGKHLIVAGEGVPITWLNLAGIEGEDLDALAVDRGETPAAGVATAEGGGRGALADRSGSVKLEHALSEGNLAPGRGRSESDASWPTGGDGDPSKGSTAAGRAPGDGAVKEPMRAVYELDPGRNTQRLALNQSFTSMLVLGSQNTLFLVDNLDPSSDLEPEMYSVGEFHEGPVRGIASLPDSYFFATAGDDGTLRVWDMIKRKLAGKRLFVFPQTCEASSHKPPPGCPPLLASGGANGVVRLEACADPSDPVVTARAVLHRGPVEALAFSNWGERLASLGKEDGRLFFQSVGSGGRSKPLVFLDLAGEGEVLAMAWIKHGAPGGGGLPNGGLVLSCASGDLLLVGAPALDARGTGPAGLQLSTEHCPTRRMSVAVPVASLAFGSGMSEGVLFSLGMDGMARRFPGLGVPEAWIEGAAIEPDAESPGHLKRGVILTTNFGEVFATASADGSVSLRPSDHWHDGAVQSQDASATWILSQERLHSIAGGGASGVTLSHNEQRLLSCGLDGSVFCQIMPSAPEDLEPSSPPPSATDADGGALQEMDVVDEAGELSIMDAVARGVAGDEGPGDASSAQGAQLRQGLSRIRDSLAAMKSANAGASAAEQLDTNEFVVDTEMVELSAKATQETVNSLQADIRREILHTEALTHRIREPCWEGMESKGLSLFSFEEAGPVVHEFHTVRDPKAAHALRRVKFLRRVEQLECSWHQAQGSRRGRSQAQIAQAGRPDAISQDPESAGEAGEAENPGSVGASSGGARPETAGTSSKADADKAAEGASGKDNVEAAAATSAKEKAGKTKDQPAEDSEGPLGVDWAQVGGAPMPEEPRAEWEALPTRGEDEPKLQVPMSSEDLLYRNVELAADSRRRKQWVLLWGAAREVRRRFNGVLAEMYLQKGKARAKVSGAQDRMQEVAADLSRLAAQDRIAAARHPSLNAGDSVSGGGVRPRLSRGRVHPGGML